MFGSKRVKLNHVKRWEASVKHWGHWDPGADFGILCGEHRNTRRKSNLVGGIPTPLKNDGVKVSWDGDIPFPFLNGKS